ncbi:MAG: histidinol dehydrogenase, partial [Candidatus Omnitrophica bacterium]|nr:histidinol dehydrogenase [Candidatus Omnitrophota bacterium]
MRIIKFPSKRLDKFLSLRYYHIPKRIQEKVKKIIEDVRLYGDEALIKYTRKFDKVKLSLKQLKVSQIEISGAYQNIEPDFVNQFKIAIENIREFYKRDLPKSWKINREGVFLANRYVPLEKVGIYIPAGSAPLVSSVYMSVIPAQIAGVKRIVLVSPPDRNGHINPYILVIADLLKVNEIYRIGGAQAIAALAYGTKTIPAVDKIIGPGNIYVTEAKRQVFGLVDIDMLAGPTELVIIANRLSNPDYVLADLNAQAEHKGSLVILITNSKSLARFINENTNHINGFIILTKNLTEAIEIANRIAPEHLQVITNRPQKIIKEIKNAGAVFFGPFSPVALGDYIAGPSHVLPTLGTARFSSGLSIYDFLKNIHFISYSKKALEKVNEPLEKITSIE